MVIKKVKFKKRTLTATPDVNMICFKDGSPTQELLGFYEVIARGGLGGIIAQQTAVSDSLATKDRVVSVAGEREVVAEDRRCPQGDAAIAGRRFVGGVFRARGATMERSLASG